ncbi:hypothetical protein ACQ3I4_04765 [Zafaria sp. Z1313]|uniref:hypothetical protein n=1 Tax=unclassified Zafaria TaxID=2828765 RepID=UPI002E75B42F|nr:hypothetical protein [Zafaria sp. J156]MEE1622358.1 hypothetical protein [Zafaria sp. J156]
MNSGSPLVKVVAAWLSAVMIVAVGVGVAITQVNQRVFGPQRVVMDYFGHLQAGEGALALGMLGTGSPDGNALLVDGDGLRAATSAIEDFEVESLERAAGGDATVTTAYSVDGRRYQTQFRLEHAGTEWLFFDRWRLVSPGPQVLRVTADTTNEFTVNGLASPLADGAQDLPVLLPAVVTASYEEKYFEAAEERRIVNSPSGVRTPLGLVTRPTQALTDDISAELKAYLDRCAEQQVLKPAACPLSYDTNARVEASTINWDIVGYPKVEVAAHEGGWVLNPLEVGTRITLVEQDLMTGLKEERSVEAGFGFTASLSVGTDSLRVVPQPVDQ